MGNLRRSRSLSRPLSVLLCLGLLASACSDDPEDDPPDGGEATSQGGDPLVVETTLGQVRGVESDVDGVGAFLGLPYAEPPTGENRWQPPQPREHYEDVFDASEPGAACPQDVGESSAGFTIIPEADEDCLSLSVWAPEDAEGLPVMFWIYGGGFRAGSGHQPYYVGDQLASKGAVVVNVNYRLGLFGFLATEELAEESEDGSYGNYGIADQLAGLEWVQDNIEAFGGDPGNVTIFGESAGAASVCAHLASPMSEDLFNRAIVQSGETCNRLGDGEKAKTGGAEVLDDLGCDDMACMRDLDTETILGVDVFGPPALSDQEAEQRLDLPPVVDDGVRFEAPARQRLEQGDLEGVELVMGANAKEAWTFSLSMEQPSDDQLLDLFARFTDEPDALAAQYPADEYADNLSRWVEMWTDVNFVCPMVALAENVDHDVYLYLYAFESEDSEIGLPPGHGIELIYLFGHPDGLSSFEGGELEGVDAELSEAMQTAWVGFATEGNPGDEWTPYSEDGQVTLLDEEVRPTGDLDQLERCDTITELTGDSDNLH